MNMYNNINKNKDSMTIKKIRTICKEKNLIICKADKGNTITILDKEDYINKVNKFIEENNFDICNKDPTSKFKNNVLKTIKSVKSIIQEQDIFKYKIMNPRSPIFYGMPKIHKENIPIRPVVSYINVPIYRICNLINTTLPKMMKCKSDYSINNSSEFINKTKNLLLNKNNVMVSFDVKSLFTSIPILELKNIINNNLETQTSPYKSDEMRLLINTCLDQNYFRFNNKFYVQKEGLAMGSPSSPLFSEIYMKDFEEKLFTNNNNFIRNNIKFWCRYVDDIFCIWNGTFRQLDTFLIFLNSLNNKIQFTMEKEENGSINFLDLTTKIENCKLKYSIYRKPTTTDSIIPFDSYQSNEIMMSALKSYVNRLNNVPLEKFEYEKEVNIIYNIAKNNGFEKKLVDKLIKRNIRKNVIKLLYNGKEREERKIYISLPYVKNTSRRISKTFNGLNVKTIEVNKNNLGKYIINNKIEERNILNGSGVYEINCKHCDGIYIGQTGRNFIKRYNEHKHNIQTQKGGNGLSDHCIETGHHMGEIKPIHFCIKGQRLNLLEGLEIKRAIKLKKNILNNQFELLQSNNIFISGILIN